MNNLSKAAKRLKRTKTDRQRAEAEAWKWCSLFIRERDGNKCVLCHRSKANGDVIQAGHVFTRGAAAIKYDPGNIFAQCSGHNYRHSIDPLPYFDWYIERFGKKAFDDLALKKKMICKRSVSDLLLIAADYKRKYEAALKNNQ